MKFPARFRATIVGALIGSILVAGVPIAYADDVSSAGSASNPDVVKQAAQQLAAPAAPQVAKVAEDPNSLAVLFKKVPNAETYTVKVYQDSLLIQTIADFASGGRVTGLASATAYSVSVTANAVGLSYTASPESAKTTAKTGATKMTLVTPGRLDIGARVGRQFNLDLLVKGGDDNYTFTVFSGTLPPGMTLNSSTGTISGSSATRGNYPVIIQVKDGSNNVAKTAAFGIRVRGNADHTISLQGTEGTYGVVVSAGAGTTIGTVSALDEITGTQITYSLEAGSAAGFAVNPSTGVITTTATVTGSVGSVKKIIVGATNGINPKETATFRIAVVEKVGIKKERFANRTSFPTDSTTGASVSDASIIHLPNDGSDAGFAARYTGFITVPTSGLYTFYDSSDDASAFYLSPNASMSSLPSSPSTSVPNWNSSAFRWDQMASQKTEPLYLVAGQLYAFKFLYVASAAGTNYMGLAWQKPGDTAPVNGSVAALVPYTAFVYPGLLEDSVPPSSPRNFLVSATTETSITLNWFPGSDNVGVDHYVLVRDGVVIEENLAQNYGMSTYVDSSLDARSGTHTYSIYAVDAAGNQSSSVTIPSVVAGRIWTPVEAAMISGDARGINTASDLMRQVNSEISALRNEVSGPINAFYAGGPFDYVPYKSGMTVDGRLSVASGAGDRLVPLIEADATGMSAAVVGKSLNGNQIAGFGISNPFASGSDISNNLTTLTKWMLTGSSTGNTSGKRAVVLEQNGLSFKNWLVSSGVVASDADVDVCTVSITDSCLTSIREADLVIVGTKLATDAGKTSEVFTALKAADQARHPILFFEDSRSYDNLALTSDISAEFGFSRSSVYWTNAIAHVTVDNLNSRSASIISSATSRWSAVETAINHLINEDWNVDLTGCPGIRDSCENVAAATYVTNEFSRGVTQTLKADLDSFVSRGVRIFDSRPDQYRVYKAAILLGDVLRRQIVYPIANTQLNSFFRALYADNTVFVLRDSAEAQPDLGSFSPTDVSQAPRISKAVSFTARQGAHISAATVYAVPGERVTVKRTDSNSSLSVKVTFTTLRSGSTHEYDAYTRPKYIQTAWTSIPAGGEINIISPYGGAMAVWIDGSSADPEPETTLEFSGGVVQHPVWDGDETTAQFEEILKTGHFNWVEILTPGFQIHSTVDKLAMSLSVQSFNDYNKMAKSAYYDFYLKNYNEAGFVGAGLTRSSTVTALCAALTIDCESRSINGIPSMNHMNADQATCGFGCSGNPYDAFWGFNALGWGDSHEMGHNIQSLHVADINGAKQTGEVSNNIFPVHTIYSWNKAHPEDTYQVSHSFDQQAMLAAFLNAQNASDPKRAMHDSGYGYVSGSNNNSPTFVVNGTTVTRGYDINSLEVNFYVQLAALAASSYTPRYSATPFGDGGWEIITLLHQYQRNYSYNHGTVTRWDAWKNAHGFSDFAQSESVGMNDLMLISTSQVLGLDMRPYLDMWGIYYSDKASAQVAKYGFPAAPKRFWYFEVEGQTDESHRPLVGITDPIGSVEIKKYGTGNIPDIATLIPNVSQLRLFVKDSNTDTVLLKRTTRLKAESAGFGTITFRENGQPILGCQNVATVKSPYDQWRYLQNYEATCDWSPQSAGTSNVTATFVPSDPKLVAPAPELRQFTVEAAGAPSVTALSVSSAAEGQFITVTGSNLDYLNGVTINGIRATMFPSSPTSAFVVVPTISDPAKADGKFVFTSPGGHAISSTDFHIVKRVASVGLPAAAVQLSPGKTVKYSPTITPSWADNTEITWLSSDATVATVDQTGRIIARSNGTAQITVRSNDTQASATVNVTVTSEDTYGSRGVNITSSESTLAKGASLSLARVIYPSNATPALTWTSSNTSVATVNSAGVVTAVNYGSVTISVSPSDGGVGDTKTLTVVPEITWDDSTDTIGALPVSGVNQWWANLEGGRSASNQWTYRTGILPNLVTGNRRVQIYPKSNLGAVLVMTFSDPSTLNKPITQSLPDVTYLGDLAETSSTVVSGFPLYRDIPSGAGCCSTPPMTIGGTTYARGLATYAGTTVTYNLAGKFSRFKSDIGIDDLTQSTKGSVQFIVTADGVELYRSPILTGASAPVSLGNGDGIEVTGVQTLTLQTLGVDSAANGLTDGRAEWAGAHLTRAVTGLSLAVESTRISVGQNYSVGASVTSATGTPNSATSLTYQSSNPSVATVDNSGEITGLAAGTARVTVTTGDGFYKKSVLVRVIPAGITDIMFAAGSYSIEGEKSLRLTPNVSIAGTYTPTYAWNSSNPQVATVAADGTVSAISVGRTVITVVDEISGYAADVTVNVTAPNVAAPLISNLSSAATKVVGEDLQLSVGSSSPDDGVLTFQWRKNGVNISGATDSTLSFGSVQLSDAGAYSVVVTNSRAGVSTSITSPNISVTVLGAALTPATSVPVSTLNGFTFNVTNFDPSYVWTVSTSMGIVSKGSPTGSSLPVTVSSLTPGQTATVTIRTTRTGFVSASATLEGVSLNSARVPLFDSPVKGDGSFSVNLTNFSNDFDWTFTTSAGNLSQGTANGDSLQLTVTGLTPGGSATISAVSSRTGFATGSGRVSGSSKSLASSPTFGAVSSKSDGFVVSINNYSSVYSYDVSIDRGLVTKGSAVGGNLPLTVSGLAAGEEATITVVVSRLGYLDVIQTVTGSAAPMQLIPEVSTSIRNSNGYTFNITNYDAAYNWVITTSAGKVTKGLATGATLPIIVTGLTSGSLATVSIKVSRTNFLGGTLTVTSSALSAAYLPTFSVPVPVDGGFTFNVTNYSGDYEWLGVVSAGDIRLGDPEGSILPVTISNLSSGQNSSVTLSATRNGYVTGQKTVVASSLRAALIPSFSAPISTDGGFTVTVTNFDPTFTWTSTASGAVVTKGKAVGKNLPLTVTGLADGSSATINLVTGKPGFLPGSNDVTGRSLETERVTSLSTPVATADGFTFNISNYEANYTYAITANKGSIVRSVAVGSSMQVSVIGLKPSTGALVTIKTSRSGYLTGVVTASGISLKAALVPVTSSLTRKPGGFTFTITNFDASYQWTVSSSYGTAVLGVPVGNRAVVTVSGLSSNQASGVLISTSKAGFASGSKTVGGQASPAALARLQALWQ